MNIGFLMLIFGITALAAIIFLVNGIMEEILWSNIIGCIFCTISIATLIFMAKTANGKVEYDVEPFCVEKVVALQDNVSVNGKVYCHRGYINEELYYNYLVDIGDGGVLANSARAKFTVVFNSDEPRVEWYHGRQKWWIFYQKVADRPIMYIPADGIKVDLKIDLE